jgi:hypothetical protein
VIKFENQFIEIRKAGDGPELPEQPPAELRNQQKGNEAEHQEQPCILFDISCGGITTVEPNGISKPDEQQ